MSCSICPGRLRCHNLSLGSANRRSTARRGGVPSLAINVPPGMIPGASWPGIWTGAVVRSSGCWAAMRQ
eukprot:5926261-Lingulodinium_polyedra.AAC.1